MFFKENGSLNNSPLGFPWFGSPTCIVCVRIMFNVRVTCKVTKRYMKPCIIFYVNIRESFNPKNLNKLL